MMTMMFGFCYCCAVAVPLAIALPNANVSNAPPRTLVRCFMLDPNVGAIRTALPPAPTYPVAAYSAFLPKHAIGLRRRKTRFRDAQT